MRIPFRYGKQRVLKTHQVVPTATGPLSASQIDINLKAQQALIDQSRTKLQATVQQMDKVLIPIVMKIGPTIR